MTKFAPLTLDEARVLIKFARCVIETSLRGCRECADTECAKVIPQEYHDKFINTKLPVFISIERLTFSEGILKRVLRGSMGIPRPLFNLLDAVKYVAYYAAFCDPRRGPLQYSDWTHCVLELAVLSEPKPVELDKLPLVLEPGYHTLVIETSSGQLVVIMPHTHIEVLEKLTSERQVNELPMSEFVKLLFEHKGVSPDEVKSAYMHETQIFCELTPDGEVIERKLFCNRLFRILRRPAETPLQEAVQLT